MNEQWKQAKEIFQEAAELPPAERLAYLDQACVDDPDLRAEVEGLLEAHREAGSFLGGFTDAVTEPATPLSEGPGTVVGRYKLLQKIGEGGFGTVYMAEQEKPVRRKVALKIIKLGMDTKQVIARFEAERQALALMDHPNIARVLDAGSTGTGRPFFVMELVRGVPITKYCDENNLSTRERLDLFMGVCGAVQHAHQKGIIHRDIKPSNVMVTLHDGTPVPKVIDFGIAKATNQRLTEMTLFTQYHQFIGTPQYMSPEQAEMSGLDVDTRTDIYSLGVLLYELLTGTTPVDPEKLRKVAYTELHRLIRDEEPQRPSTRVSTLGEAATTTAKLRSTDARTLRRTLSGDLDWIVMKALEKDRTRRYETANSLLLDVQRHLDNEPVLASPPTPAYRLRKFVRRNRTAVTVGATVCVALLGGLGLASYGFVQASRERALARQEAASSELINRFFTDMLASVDPLQLGGYSIGSAGQRSGAPSMTTKQTSVKEMLLSGIERMDDAFPGKPLLEARARETIGASLLGLGELEPAVEQFEQAVTLREQVLPADDRSVLRSRAILASGLCFAGQMVPAEEVSRDVLRIAEAQGGAEDTLALFAAMLYGTAAGQTAKFDLADSVFAVTLERQRRVLGSEHRDTVRSLLEWAALWCWRGNGARAESLASEAYETATVTFGRDDPLTLAAGAMYTLSLAFLGRGEEAEPLVRPMLARAREIFGDDHPLVKDLKFSLIRSLSWTDDAEEVEALFQENEDSPELWVGRRDYGNFLLYHKRYKEALDVFARQYEYWSTVEESENVDRDRLLVIKKQAYRHYHDALRDAGREGEQPALVTSWLEVLRRSAESEKAVPAEWENYAWALVTVEPRELRDPATALRYATKAVEATERSADRVTHAGNLDTRAAALARAGRIPEALVDQLAALDLWYGLDPDQKQQGTENLRNWTLRAVRYALEAGQDTEAQSVIDRAVLAMAQVPDTLTAARAINTLAGQMRSRGWLDLAEPVRRRALELARTTDDPQFLLYVMSVFASVRFDQGAREEAEALIREAQRIYADRYVRGPVDWKPGMGYSDSGERSRTGVGQKSLIANVLIHGGHYREAEALMREARCSDPEVGAINMGRILFHQGRTTEAEDEFRSAYESDLRAGDDQDWPGSFSTTEGRYGRCLARNGKFEEAEDHLLAAHARALECGGPHATIVAEIAGWIQELYDAWGKRELAAQWRNGEIPGGD